MLISIVILLLWSIESVVEAGNSKKCLIARKSKTLKGTWQCGVYGRSMKDPKDYDTCIWYPGTRFAVNDDKVCEVVETPKYNCKNDFKKTVDVYHMEQSCECGKDYFGNACSIKKPSNYDEKSHSKHFAVFYHHIYTYKNRLVRKVFILAKIENNDRQPFTVKIINTEATMVLFSKPTDTIKSGGAQDWCLKVAQLAEYCDRFMLIFNPKPNGDNKAQQTIYLTEIPVPMCDQTDFKLSLTPQFDIFTLGNNQQLIGARQSSTNTVRLIKYLNPFFLDEGKRVGDASYLMYGRHGDTIINYTSVDISCFPRFYMQSCRPHYEKNATTINMNEELNLMIDYRKGETCRSKVQLAESQWTINKVKYDYDPQKHSSDWLLQHSGQNYKIEKWTFSDAGEGLYHVTFRAKHFIGQDGLENLKMCFFRVKYKTLKVQFTDGPERYVNTEDVNVVSVDATDMNVEPSKQKDGITFTWSCTLNGTNQGCGANVEKYFTNSPTLRFPKYTLKLGSKYTIKVKVHNDRLGSECDSEDHQTLIVLTKEAGMFTLCCGSCSEGNFMNPREFNMIHVRGLECRGHPEREADAYVWEYREDGSGDQYQSADSLRADDDTSKYLFKIKKNALDFGKTYIFRAKATNGNVTATVKIKTLEYTFKLDCSVTPDSGIKGWTDFALNCSIPEDESLYYEYYDKEGNDDQMFSGRMLGFGDTASLQPFKMTKGDLVVLAYNPYKMIYNYTQSIKISDFNDTVKYLEELAVKSKEMIDNQNYDWPTRIQSSIAEVLVPKMNPNKKIIGVPLQNLEEVRLSEALSSVKMVLASLKVVLEDTSANFGSRMEEDADLPRAASHTLLALTDEFLKHESGIKDERTLTQTIFLEMAKAIIDCAEIILQRRNLEVKSKLEYYVNPFVMKMVHETSFAVVKCLEMVGVALNRQQSPGDVAQTILSTHGNIFAISKVDYTFDLSNWTFAFKDSKVNIPLNLAGSIGRRGDTTGIQYIRVSIDPFWWTRSNIVTDVLLVTYYLKLKESENFKLTKFKFRMVLYLNVTEPLDSLKVTEGVAPQLDPKTNAVELDLSITVYRFILPPRAKLFIKFLFDGAGGPQPAKIQPSNFPSLKPIISSNNTESKENDTILFDVLKDSSATGKKTRSLAKKLKVVFTEDLRPDYESLKRAMTITPSSPDLNVRYQSSHDTIKTYYMAVYPPEDVHVGEEVAFRFRAHYSLCQTWFKWYWTAQGCWVGKKTSMSGMQCDCDHLSTVAGAMATPDHGLVPTWEFLLYLTPWVDMLPLIILFLILLGYLLLLIFAIMMDKKDKAQGDIIILWDNFPGEHYAYLLGVFTGCRIAAGTSSVVGVRIFGDNGESRAHILRDVGRKVLRTNCDDWFLLYYHTPLGDLQRVMVWHNNTGSSPDWFLEKIEIYDLSEKERYVFPVNQWLSIDMDSSPEIVVEPMEAEQYFKVQSIFRTNFMNGIKDKNNYTSIFMKHPRNPVTRVQRLSTVLVFFLVAMAATLLLYMKNFGFGIREDKPSFYLIDNDLLLFIVAFVVASISAASVLGLFRKSSTFKYTPKIKEMRGSIHRPSRFSVETGILNEWGEHLRRYQAATDKILQKGMERYSIMNKPKRERSASDQLLMIMYKSNRGQELLPMKLPQYKDDLVFVNKKWYLFAWILFGLLVLLSLVTILSLSWRLPTVKAEKFLFVFGAIILFDIFVVSLLVLIIASAILGFMYQDLVPPTTIHVKRRDGIRRELYGDETFLSEMLEARRQKEYYPLSEDYKQRIRDRKLRRKRWKELVDFFIVLFLMALLYILLWLFFGKLFYLNDHARNMMTKTSKTDFNSFNDVFNRSDYENFLNSKLLSSLYKYLWYNLQPLNDPSLPRKDWTEDSVTRLLGNTRIRQLRVKPHECSENKYFENMTQPCSRPWSRKEEDDSVYGTGWVPGAYEDTRKKTTTWRYTTADHSNCSGFTGKSGIYYHGGGYITDMGYDKRDSRGTMVMLEKEEWLDSFTRGVFVELTLYNVNKDRYTAVGLVAEQTPFGEYLTLPKAASVNTNIEVNIYIIAILIFPLAFYIRMLYKVNREGCFVYLSQWVNVFELTRVILGFSVVMMYIVHIKTTSEYVREFHSRGLDEFFSFTRVYRYENLTSNLLCLWYVFLFLSFLRLFKFGRRFFIYFLAFALLWTAAFVSAIFLALWLRIIWRYIGYNLNIFNYSHQCMYMLFYRDYNATKSHTGSPSPMLVYSMCLASALVLYLLVASNVSYYRMAKEDARTKIHLGNYSYFIFLKDEIVRLFNKQREKMSKTKSPEDKNFKEDKSDKTEPEKKDSEKKEPDKKEPEKRRSEKKDPDKKEPEKKDPGKKEPDKKEPEKDTGKKEPDKKGSEKNEKDKKGPDKK